MQCINTLSRWKITLGVVPTTGAYHNRKYQETHGQHEQWRHNYYGNHVGQRERCWLSIVRWSEASGRTWLQNLSVWLYGELLRRGTCVSKIIFCTHLDSVRSSTFDVFQHESVVGCQVFSGFSFDVISLSWWSTNDTAAWPRGICAFDNDTKLRNWLKWGRVCSPCDEKVLSPIG